MSSDLKNIRAVVVGDEKVGKSSLIHTIISENFHEDIPAVISPSLIPQEMCFHGVDVSTAIIDTSSAGEDESVTEEEIGYADIILLVYDVSRKETRMRLEAYWLPKLSRLSNENRKIPIIIIANKIDLATEDDDSGAEFSETVKQLCRQFPQVEMGIEASAKLPLNLSEIVYYTQRVVLFPVTPLYDSFKKEFKPYYEAALKRIFRLFDKDRDTILSDKEFYDMQQEIFKMSLNEEDLSAIKELIVEKSTEEAIHNGGITYAGFECHHRLFIEKAKVHSCWMLLKHCGYNDDLRLKPELYALDLEVSPDQAVELSFAAIEFLRDIFNMFADQGLLYFRDIDEIFATMPDGCPWKNIEKRIPLNNNTITFESWIGLWAMQLMLDYKSTLEAMKYMGFEQPVEEAVTVSKRRYGNFNELFKSSQKKIFRCYVFGSLGVGKSCLLDAMIEKDFSDKTRANIAERSVCNYRKLDKKTGLPIYICMTEFPDFEIDDMLNNPEKLYCCDCALVLYDGTKESLLYAREIVQNLPEEIPRILVNSKSDNVFLGQQSVSQELEEITRSLNMMKHVRISCKNKKISHLLDVLTEVLPNPSKCYPPDVYRRVRMKTRNQMERFTRFFFSVGGLLIFAYLSYAKLDKLTVYLQQLRTLFTSLLGGIKW